MTNVSYAVAPSNASQEYFSNISSALRLSGRLKQTAKGAVLSLQRRVDNTVPLLYPVCVGRSHVFRKRPQGVAQTLSAAKRGGAERLCDGCPCVGAEEICGVPSPNPCRSVDNTAPSAYPLRTRPAPKLKNVKRLTYEATPDSATVDKLCFQPAQAHPWGGTAASMFCRAAGAVARASRRKKN